MRIFNEKYFGYFQDYSIRTHHNFNDLDRHKLKNLAEPIYSASFAILINQKYLIGELEMFLIELNPFDSKRKLETNIYFIHNKNKSPNPMKLCFDSSMTEWIEEFFIQDQLNQLNNLIKESM